MKIKTIGGHDFEVDFDAELNAFINEPDVLVKDIYFRSTSIEYNGKIVDRYIAHVYYKRMEAVR